MSQSMPPNLPPSAPSAASGPLPVQEAPRGSLLKGFLLAWLILILAEPSAFMLVTKIGAGAAVIPPLAIIVIGIVLKVRDRSRTGTGLLLGLLAFVAVAILLVAACFGLFFNGNFDNMH
jgi:hypothetical protein